MYLVLQEDSERFSRRVDTYLKPAIVQLAVAVQGSTGSTMLWKPLNHQLLMCTRHDSPTVRFAALQVTQALIERLGEEYLALVPETLPFVVEVLEDMDEEVEGAARSLVGVLETLLGESLNEYLTQ
jgi:U3 small nucleolar RNA-associated protein 10